MENTMTNEKLSITKIATLHLLPGIIITLVFSAIATWTTEQNLPAPLAILFTWVLAGIPFELGFLLYQGYLLNHRVSLQGIILFREPLNKRTFIWLVPLLVLWALVVLTLLTPSANKIMFLLFSWFPKQLILSDFAHNISSYPRWSLWLVLILSGILNIVVPVIEELYFRGFLLPRMSSLNHWAPLASVALFSLYHFWLPWEFLNRIIALLPMTYAVWRNKNIFIGIWVHCLINSIGTLGLLAFILNQ